jgi:hypothetical protein
MARNTLQSILNFCGSSTGGRAVLETFGDSTAERNGNGWSYGFQAAFSQIVPCAGILCPPNHNSGSSETHGYWQMRRLGNGATMTAQVGCVNPVDIDSQGGYQTTFKQYGYQVPLRAGWQGPQCAFFAHTTLSGAINTAVTTIPVTDGTIFSNGAGASKRAYIFDGTNTECILYTNTATSTQITSVTRNSFTALATGGAGAGNPQSFSSGAIIAQMDNSNSSGFRFWPSHPLDGSADLVSAAWSMSTYATAATSPAGSFVMQTVSTVTPPVTDTTWTTVVAAGSPLNKTGTALGTLSKNTQTITRGSRESVSITVPLATGNALGPIGPNCILYYGCFASDRPYGFIPSMGISQGSKRLNEMLLDLRQYHTPTGIVHFDTGMVARFKVYIDAASAGVGGNGRAGFVGVYAGGHNDSGGGNYNAIPTPSVPWTVNTTLTGSTVTSGATSITVTSTAGLNAGGGTIRWENELMTYTGFTANTSINGVTRGQFGTVAAAHDTAQPIYVGYPLQHPRGFLADMLWYYLHLKSLWVSAGGNADYFWFVWPRPIPTSASPVSVADSTAIANNNEREFKLQRYWQEFENLLQNQYDGLVGINTADTGIWGGSEAETLDYSDAGDPVHHKRHGYALSVGKAIRREAGLVGFSGEAGGIVLTNSNLRGRG